MKFLLCKKDFGYEIASYCANFITRAASGCKNTKEWDIKYSRYDYMRDTIRMYNQRIMRK